MTTQRIHMKKLRELLRLKFDTRLSHRQIGRALNVSAGTVSYYVQAAIQVGLTWPLPNDLDDKALIQAIEPVAKQLRTRPSKPILPPWNSIHRALSQKHMTLMLLWEDYVKENPQRHYIYTQFTRLYKSWSQSQQVTLRLEHKAGEKGFIDYAGTTIPVYCRETSDIDFHAQIFLMVLGLSHYTFAYATRSQQLPDWIDAHKRAFQFFGGVPQVLVPDNLKAGITDSCQFEPLANPTYADMAAHYGTAIIPARPYTPRDKAIAENAVLITSRWIIARLSQQKFYSLYALNQALHQLLTRLNQKPFQKRQGCRYQQFIDIERAALRPLPKTPYTFATLTYQTVPKDYHVRLDKHYYSVPYTLVNQSVLCRYTQNTVEIFYQHRRVASHLRSFQKDKKTTVLSHMPKAHRAYQQWTPQVFLEWAHLSGLGVWHVAKKIVEKKSHPEQCSKIHFGLKRLCKRFGARRLNQACRRALVLQCIEFKSIRSILENGIDKTPHVRAVPPPTTAMHDNVRGAAYYQSYQSEETSSC